ncbi:MAG TPA: hypothetical protein VF789_11025 [Thermoanaerobaculia bacterium]
MTNLLAKAFSEAGKLPESEQDALARWLLEEIESEKTWQGKFAVSHSLLQRMSQEALEEDRRGETKDLDPDLL